MRHFYSFLLLAVLSCIAGTNAWAYDFVADGIFYNITSAEDLTVEVTYETTSYRSYSGDVVIPATVENEDKTYSVTSIGGYAFRYCSGLTSIEIPSSMTSFGEFAFDGCSGLTSIEIPSGVTRIGNYVFFCSGLTSIEIPSGVTHIGECAFQGCTSLTSIEIPSGVTSLSDNAFVGCSGLTSIEVSSDNSVYDSRNNCNAIIETASNTLIAGCQNTVIPADITSIGSYAFHGRKGLTNIEIPNSVTSFGYCAFYDCQNLESIDFPDGLTSIGPEAFAMCTSLTSIEIPSSVTSISGSPNPFYGCSGLTSIVVASGNSVYDSRNNCNAIIETASNKLIAGCQNSFIPEGVTSIGYCAFNRCTGLTSIEIPNSVTSIGGYSFYGCFGLRGIVVPNSVTSIDYLAFQSVRVVVYAGDATGSPWGAGMVYTTSPDEYGFIYADEEKTQTEFYAGTGGDVIIPDGVTSIGLATFFGCNNMRSVTLPTSVTSIGNYAFQDCIYEA